MPSEGGSTPPPVNIRNGGGGAHTSWCNVYGYGPYGCSCADGGPDAVRSECGCLTHAADRCEDLGCDCIVSDLAAYDPGQFDYDVERESP